MVSPWRFFRDERQRRSDLPREERAELLRRVGDVGFEGLHDVSRPRRLEEDRAAVDHADRVQAELEVGHDTEVAAAAAKRTEEVGVVVFARVHELAVRGHDVGGDEIVERQPVPAREVPDAAAEGEAGDAGRRHDAAHGG